MFFDEELYNELKDLDLSNPGVSKIPSIIKKRIAGYKDYANCMGDIINYFKRSEFMYQSVRARLGERGELLAENGFRECIKIAAPKTAKERGW